MYVLSNSSKRKSASLKHLKELGVEESIFEDVVTSGEVGWSILSYLSSGSKSSYLPNPTYLSSIKTSILPTPSKPRPLKVYIFGADQPGDIEYVKSTGNSVVTKPSDADVIVARGTGVVIDPSGDNITPLGVGCEEGSKLYEKVVKDILKGIAEEGGEGALCCALTLIWLGLMVI
eukprot:CAMPEP_0118659122 /NCGR_PEP_ID=MMETSP0785-20121206/14936_1 /TAXON_ID=91992 /ORGANISM="Bolidomonas pacifica, Strain CCMP 1866" /LENGTH=174 /DNA_ID=CAMNT_0006552191 /DNA_START=281 /DNA_END=805 /DNA_ORIENTATION=+